MIRLTPNFALHEALVGTTLRTIPPEDYNDVLAHAQAMEQVRALLGGKPITITSWYRPPDKNAAVGGSATSDHPTGRASDFKVKGMTPHEVVAALMPQLARLGIDQVIEYSGHTHIGTGGRRRAQALLNVGKDEFVPWTLGRSAPTIVPTNEPGAPKKWSPLWWVGVVIALAEVARRFFLDGQ